MIVIHENIKLKTFHFTFYTMLQFHESHPSQFWMQKVKFHIASTFPVVAFLTLKWFFTLVFILIVLGIKDEKCVCVEKNIL